MLICKNCNKKITSGSKSGLCGSCSMKKLFENKENHPRFEGAQFRKYFCKKCNTEITNQSKTKLCRRCSCIGRRYPNRKPSNKRGTYEYQYGIEKAQEIKHKLSVANTGEKGSFYGKTHTKEAKLKIGLAASLRNSGRHHTEETRRKMRLRMIERINRNKSNGNQMYPAYNPRACELIDEYGKQYGYNFQHAMNGGEHFIPELGYWVDGYDKEKNVVLEIDEKHHFDGDGNLKKKDVIRQKEIEESLKCKFLRFPIS